ncbi:MAG: multidrug efflux pump subunit AcrB, partial [Planctomycetota bacterium]
MFALIVGGVFGLSTIKVEMFPEFSLDRITVQVPYPGAAPEEIEQGICIKIEEDVHSIEGVDKVTSTAIEGLGTVVIALKSGASSRVVLDDVKTRVGAISTFPEDAEEPIIQEMLLRRQVVNVAIHGDAPEATLRLLGERMRDEISSIEGISQVELTAVRPYEVSIEVSEHALISHGLTFDDVANAVRNSSVDLSGGSLKTRGGEILLRSVSQAYDGEDFASIVVLNRADGTRVRLDQVATVVDGFEDTDQASRFDGERTVMVQVYRIGNESALAISESVGEYVAGIAPHLPEGVQADTWQDQSLWLQSRLDLLIKNGLQGGFLVFLVLALFLKFRLSLWVTLGIPVSFLGTFMVMPWLDQSLNMLSLFAFLLVLGIVVDDAIVVGESVHSEHLRGHSGSEGAKRGVRAVAIPVVFAVLTTIVAFLPIVFLPTVTGKFFAVVPMVVIPALLFSLVESQLILPAHLAHEEGWMERLAKYPPFSWWVRFQSLFTGGLQWVAKRLYQPLLETALAWRYTTVAVAIASLLVTLGAVQAGWLSSSFFPEIEGDIIAAQVRMPQGSSVRVTREAVAQIEAAAATLIEEVDGANAGSEEAYFVHYMASVGEQPYLSQKQQTFGGGDIRGPEFGEVVIELSPAEGREISATDLNERWAELTGPIAGAAEVNFDAALMSNGPPIDLQLSGPDSNLLKLAAEEFKLELARFDGMREITDSFRGGKQELVLELLPQAEALGITQLDLARQVRQGFYGEEAQRIQRGRDDVRVMVRYPEAVRDSLFAIEQMRIRRPNGIQVPFSEVAQVHPQRGFSTIQRNDRQRTVHVTAEISTP